MILQVLSSCGRSGIVNLSHYYLIGYSIIITTHDPVGFDKASVGMSTADIGDLLEAGQYVKLTILPEIRESYPVQVTATKVEVIKPTYQKNGRRSETAVKQ